MCVYACVCVYMRVCVCVCVCYHSFPNASRCRALFPLIIVVLCDHLFSIHYIHVRVQSVYIRAHTHTHTHTHTHSTPHLRVPTGPVVAGAPSVLRHIDVLLVVEFCVGGV